MTFDNDLNRLADLINSRNQNGSEITSIIGRPAQLGHIGEYIASKVFDIRLHESAVHKGSDGTFQNGVITGSTVNIKFYGRREGILDIRRDALPDYFLVFTGPVSSLESSKFHTRPWLITNVYLFNANILITELKDRKLKIGTATSVAKRFWEAAEVYPDDKVSYGLSERQQRMLSLFG